MMRFAVRPISVLRMPLIFSYGSLQTEDIQLSTFGRLLDGHQDEVVGFMQSALRIEDPAVAAAIGQTHHANLLPSANKDDRVSGMVFEITDAELTAVDRYERAFMYERVLATLASGGEAWVYVFTRP